MGSNPIGCTKIVPLCNGSTADFGSVSLGSSPSGTARMVSVGWRINALLAQLVEAVDSNST